MMRDWAREELGTRRGTAKARLRKRWQRRPTVQALEDRQLLSTFTVTDTSDNPSDTGSLRYAIDQANADHQANTINFGPLFNTPQTITTLWRALSVEAFPTAGDSRRSPGRRVA